MKLDKITLLMACVALFTACSQEVEGPLYTGEDGFSFAASVLNVETSAEDQGKILVPVYRGNTTENTVRLKFEFEVEKSAAEGEESAQPETEWVAEDPAGIFSLTTPKVIFSDGAHVAYAQIRYTDIEALGLTTKYKMRLTIEENVSPSNKGVTTLSVNRQLTFDLLGKCQYFDVFIFENAYETEIYRAREAEIYRVMDPYSEGLLKEEYVSYGLAGSPSAYVQFMMDEKGMITYEPFNTGMLFQMSSVKYEVFCYYPTDYLIEWGADFSKFCSENRRLDEKTLQLYPVYVVPEFRHGFLNEGTAPITITLP